MAKVRSTRTSVPVSQARASGPLRDGGVQGLGAIALPSDQDSSFVGFLHVPSGARRGPAEQLSRESLLETWRFSFGKAIVTKAGDPASDSYPTASFLLREGWERQVGSALMFRLRVEQGHVPPSGGAKTCSTFE
jgi:hypothetical protein